MRGESSRTGYARGESSDQIVARHIADASHRHLTYRVQPRTDLARQVLGVIERHPGEAGIVYCISRKDVERLDAGLRDAGVRSVAYHAGLEPNEVLSYLAAGTVRTAVVANEEHVVGMDVA